MAITFVSQATGTIATGSSNTNVSLPGSLQEDDLVIVGTVNDGSVGNSDGAGGVNSTAGYTLIVASGASNPGCELQRKFMGATPDTTVNIHESSVRPQAYIIQAFRGVDSTTPLDVVVTSASGSTGMPDCGSITPTNDDTLILAVGFLDDDGVSTSVGAPSGYSNLVTEMTSTIEVSSGSHASAMMCSKTLASAAAENPGIFTDSSGLGDDQWHGYTVALRPASGGFDGILPLGFYATDLGYTATVSGPSFGGIIPVGFYLTELGYTESSTEAVDNRGPYLVNVGRLM